MDPLKKPGAHFAIQFQYTRSLQLTFAYFWGLHSAAIIWKINCL